MSGMDRNTFITNYRAEDVEKLTLRMKNGLGSSKYKPAEYQKLQTIVDAKRLESDLIGLKVQKTRCAAKATKESSVLRQHRQVWSRECPRLQKAEEKAENDIKDFLQQLRPNGRTDTAIFFLQDFGVLLEREREAFRKATVEPVLQLKDDLCFRLGEAQRQDLIANQSDGEEVKQQIHFVKDQQDEITAKLNTEYQVLEEEIIGCGLEKYLTSTSDDLVIIGSCPEEVLESNCPYPELKVALIQAFHSLSERYQSRLQDLQDQLQTTDRFCGWCADDHQRFLSTLSQYTQDQSNHRALYMDLLQRLFPEKSKQELMEHERVWDWQRLTQAQLRVVTQQCERDQEELLARALVTLQEARHAHQEELKLHRGRQHQQDICSQLREKLQQWRAQQEEVAKLEAAIAARQQEEEEARLRREQEKEAVVRSHHKEKVRQFHLQQQKRRETLAQRDQERLANLRSLMEEQARRDKDRVQYRAEMLQRRKEEREARELERQREDEEKQNRLEVLRNQVGVVAEADPERMMADTEAWRSRQLNVKESELQRPLYSIHTYTDTQIVSDPRVRVEQALREAGLQHSQYAKDVLSVLRPPKPPRRDTQSDLKF
ncbi:coiled-coil domain-containing protein 148-like [Trematomus bernacchii]|uniref:coiled-coil domain-containing protein 148-like n=1 Tax=Trematomus bernacchii TaxID=40690 RepID=UPI00146F87FC|nr:coiled-coil domain-containing protein 148-like [Trematomus bernacchii]XP_033990584.1 coiled-coil domain-containing protein 148-like [Trematomus bernacchii]